MQDQNYIELIHTVLDDEASEEDKARLERLLAEQPQARETFDELRALHQILSETPSVDPPADLKDRILVGMANSRARPESTARTPAGPPLPRHQWLRYAASVAVGFVLGGVVGTTAYHELTGPESTEDPLVGLAGAMVIHGEGPVSQATVHQLTLPGLSGNLTLSRYEQVKVLTIDIRETEDVILKIALDGELRVEGFAGLEDNQPKISLAEDRLQMPLEPHRYAIFLRTARPTVPIELYRDGELIHRTELEIPRPE